MCDVFVALFKSADHDEASAACGAGHVSLVGQQSLWMLLSYQPTEVQELPQACYSQLMHSLSLPLRDSSPSRALPLCLIPSLSFLSCPSFSMSYCSLHLPYPLPLPRVLTTLLHHALFLPPALSYVHMHLHTHTDTDTETVAATTTVCNLPHTPARLCASASGLP